MTTSGNGGEDDDEDHEEGDGDAILFLCFLSLYQAVLYKTVCHGWCVETWGRQAKRDEYADGDGDGAEDVICVMCASFDVHCKLPADSVRAWLGKLQMEPHSW
jgi:hypothetical protein